MKNKKDKSLPYLPPEYDIADVRAIQDLINGEADERQQKRAIKWIIEKACQTYDLPFRPGGDEGDRNTNFACGRMFVGQQIVKLSKLDLLALKQNEEIINPSNKE